MKKVREKFFNKAYENISVAQRNSAMCECRLADEVKQTREPNSPICVHTGKRGI